MIVLGGSDGTRGGWALLRPALWVDAQVAPLPTSILIRKIIREHKQQISDYSTRSEPLVRAVGTSMQTAQRNVERTVVHPERGWNIICTK